MAVDTSVLAEMLAKRRYCRACGQPLKMLPQGKHNEPTWVHVGKVAGLGAWLFCPGKGEPKPDEAA